LRITLVITEVRLTERKTNLGKCRAEAFSGYHLLGEGCCSGAEAKRSAPPELC